MSAFNIFQLGSQLTELGSGFREVSRLILRGGRFFKSFFEGLLGFPEFLILSTSLEIMLGLRGVHGPLELLDKCTLLGCLGFSLLELLFQPENVLFSLFCC